jgi:hypothetical protein
VSPNITMVAHAALYDEEVYDDEDEDYLNN